MRAFPSAMHLRPLRPPALEVSVAVARSSRNNTESVALSREEGQSRPQASSSASSVTYGRTATQESVSLGKFGSLEKGHDEKGLEEPAAPALAATTAFRRPDLNFKEIHRGDNGAKLKYIPFVGRKVPRDPFPSLEQVPEIPLAAASSISRWTQSWIQPLIILGHQRPLQVLDLWQMDQSRLSGPLADRLLENFKRRKQDVEEWNAALENGSYKPSRLRAGWWRLKKRAFDAGTGDGKRKVSLTWALSDTWFYTFWGASLIKITGDVAQVMSPLVTKALIKYATNAFYASRGVEGLTSPSVGHGIGLAFALWFLQLISAFCLHQYFVVTMDVGVSARGALIAAIYRRAISMSGKARASITTGALISHVSTDVSRIDFAAGMFHLSWTALIQLVIIVVILLVNLGPSSLAGVVFLVLTIFPQTWTMKKMLKMREKAMVFTDKRVKLINELLGGMRIIKFFSWESPYINRLDSLRNQELKFIRGLLIIRAANTAVAMSLPFLATVVAFAIYAGTGHSQDPGVIFTSLTLFNLLRMPLMLLPMAFSVITDASNAIGRLTHVFIAEQIADPFVLEPDAKDAIKVVDGSFIWEGASPEHQPASRKLEAELKASSKRSKKEAEPTDPTAADNSSPSPQTPQETLQLRDINISIPRGSLTAVVGTVGSGKSSLLQALTGEMRRTSGTVTLGGTIAYCAQQAWIQNATLKENVTFGKPWDEARYHQVLEAACLQADIAMLPAGDMTEIGEKGITLSGGQKQRVNIARALYFDADAVLLDDPLSAVDAHVGKHLFDNAICGMLKDKTRLLVTHALHCLPRVDYIICMDRGQITERGTYEELMSKPEGAFKLLMDEFGGGEQEEAEVVVEAEAIEHVKVAVQKEVFAPKQGLMQEEERITGGVGGNAYLRYFVAGNFWVTLPLLFVSLVLNQAAQAVGSYWLVWWQHDTFTKPVSFYVGLYAMFGVLQTLLSFVMGVAGVLVGYNASQELHFGAIRGIMRAPSSFFDTTPLGRILNRFSKDQDSIDNTLNESMRMLFVTLSAVVGAIILIGVVIPYFLIAVFAVLYLYWLTARFYRSSAREIKRLDNLLRSILYGFFSESLSGLATIRAYGKTGESVKINEGYIDLENRAYLLTVYNQRWLGFRLDIFGGVLIFIVAGIVVAVREKVTPSQTGLVLAYILMIQQSFSWMVRQGAEVENDMNSTERLLFYNDHLEAEAPAVVEAFRPPEAWPSQGAISMKKVVMAYRPGLPPVLKGISLEIAAGEKVGVVGRTGSGKSSTILTLFRIVEIMSGTIEIDGIDISKIGLDDLRTKLAIIPQDPLLFSGTLRTNLDPFSVYDDSRLYDALRRATLIESTPAEQAAGAVATPPSRFSLDLPIEDEGTNLSVGERSLVSLARALVKDSKIIALDEATASIDAATDARVQKTIRAEFGGQKTLLTIAHRLRTIIAYDRVLVLDAGTIAEFDTPLALFDREDGVFRGMCDQSKISREDIVNAANEF